MSGHPKLDMAVAATSTVLTADQLMKALEANRDGKEDQIKQHLAYATIGAAVAVGAIEILRRDERAEKEGQRDLEIVEIDENHRHRHHHKHNCECGHCNDDFIEHLPSNPDNQLVLLDNHHKVPTEDREPSGHKRRLVEEMAGVYALGEEILGNKKNHVAHVVAEVLGAVAAFKDTKDHIHGGE